MYISRIVYSNCCSFQDTNRQGSSLPSSLFNLTQNYYYVVSNGDEMPEVFSDIEDAVEKNTVQVGEQFS